MRMPQIDFEYWEKQNPYYGDNPLSKGMIAGLKYAARGGLIPTHENWASRQELVRDITSRINNIQESGFSADSEKVSLCVRLDSRLGRQNRQDAICTT